MLDLEREFSQIVSEENFWLVNGKNINEKIIFVRRDQVPDINHLNQFVQVFEVFGAHDYHCILQRCRKSV